MSAFTVPRFIGVCFLTATMMLSVPLHSQEKTDRPAASAQSDTGRAGDDQTGAGANTDKSGLTYRELQKLMEDSSDAHSAGQGCRPKHDSDKQLLG